MNLIVHVERRPGHRFVSEVLKIRNYNSDTDLFDCVEIFRADGEPAAAGGITTSNTG
jgi:hypothetical protein